tara:strand:- start:325 stop:1065 length:741 start_codon:yes stop_codon:yes gene_type:complete
MAIHESINDGIVRLVMDNPPVNALNISDTYSLAEKIRNYSTADSQGKVILLTAMGKGFCAGVDIKEMQKMPGNQGIIEANRSCYQLFKAIEDSIIPVLVAVNGHCLGSGIGIAGSADVLIAAEGATFGLPEIDNGALGGATYLLRLVSIQRARWMLYSCETATAEELKVFGSVLKVVSAEDLDRTLTDLAETIAKKNPELVRAAKASFDGIVGSDLSRKYRFEQGYTFEMNLLGIGDKARDAFLEQ